MRFIGVDLAWRDHNATGVAVLEGDKGGAALVGPPRTMRGVEAVVDAVVDACVGGPAFVAVDAPLAVPNPSGRRPCEAALARDFARFHAGPHPANRALLGDAAGEVAGERLVAALCRGYGFDAVPVPATDAGSLRRLVFEAFPHPAQVALFGLPARIRYKHGPPEERRAGLATLRGHMLGLLKGGDPPLLPSAALAEFFAVELDVLRGAALKDYEDRLDALVCAYVACYYWRWGAGRCRMYGDVAGGYIITPALLSSRSTSPPARSARHPLP